MTTSVIIREGNVNIQINDLNGAFQYVYIDATATTADIDRAWAQAFTIEQSIVDGVTRRATRDTAAATALAPLLATMSTRKNNGSNGSGHP